MRRPRGAVNLVNLTLTVALVSAVYVGWLYVPLWLDDLDVREAISAGLSQLSAENAAPDALVRVQNSVAARLTKVGTHWEEQDGRQVQVPGLGLDPEDVKVEQGSDGRSARITVDYARTVRLKPLERYWTVQFHTTHEANLKP